MVVVDKYFSVVILAPRIYRFAIGIIAEYVWKELIKELTQANGILKTSEDGFTLAHRTIQEYLAARDLPMGRRSGGEA